MGMDRKIEKKKGIRPKHIIYFLSIAAFIVLVVKIIAFSNTSTYKVDKERITISSVEHGNFKDYVSLIGNVEPITTIYLDVDEAGKVKELVIEEGEMVKKGDVILRLKSDDLNMTILREESSLAYYSNELRNTKINMERQKIANQQQWLETEYDIIRLKRNFEQNEQLYKKGFVSEEEYTLSKERYEHGLKNKKLIHEKLVQDSIFRVLQTQKMNMNLDNMQNNLELVRERLENLNVKAPVNGQLGTLDAEIGQSISKGQRIGQIHILDNFKVMAQVDEHYIDRVRIGLLATFERQDQQFTLQVKKVYPEVRNGQFEIDLHFTENTPDNLRTGQTYHLKLELGQPTEATLLARGGFFQSTGGQWIYVLDETEKFATKRNIKIGRQNMQYYELLDGLEPGEKVITSNYELFGENDRIVMK